MRLPEPASRALRARETHADPRLCRKCGVLSRAVVSAAADAAFGILQYTVFGPEDLLEILSRIMPDEVLPLFDDFLQKLYPKSGAAVISVSAVTAAWSASNGIYGMARGSARCWMSKRREAMSICGFLCLFYMLLFVLGLVLTLLLHVFGRKLLSVFTARALPLARTLSFCWSICSFTRSSCSQRFFPCSISLFRTESKSLACASGGVGCGGRVAVIFCAVFRLRQPLCKGARALWEPHNHGPHHALGLRLREHRLLRRVFQPPVCPAPREPHILCQNAPEQSGAFSFSVTL